MTTTIAIVLATFLSPLIYLLIAALSKPASSVADLLYANRTLSPADYADTTFMYGVQVAALVLFVAWGYQYGLFALVVPFFWAVGYLGFSLALNIPRLRDTFLSANFGTLHSFLAREHSGKSIAWIAAGVSLVALAGPAMYEPFFVAGTIANGLGFAAADVGKMQLLVFLLFVVVSAIYLTIGGFRTVAQTNKWQLFVGYTAFNAFLALLIYNLNAVPSDVRSYFSMLFLLLSLSMAAVAWVVQLKQAKRDLLTVSSHLLAGVFFALTYLTLPAATASTSFVSFIASQFVQPFPWVALVGLLIANGLYQFVDVGQWQRLLALDASGGKATSTEEERAAAMRQVARANLLAGTASALSWCVAVFFGVLMKVAYPQEDPFSILGTALNRLAPFDNPLVAFLFVMAIIAIMFSTLDALCASVSFTVQTDWFGIGTSSSESQQRSALLRARIITLGLIVIYVLYYLWLRDRTAGQPDAILYASWSLQIGLLPAVLAALFSRKSWWGSVLSMIGGAIGAMYLVAAGKADLVFELGPILALGGAAVGFAVGMVLDRSRIFVGSKQ
jgi:Na+/pantothenate symporter